MNIWAELLSIIKNLNLSPDVRNMASMLLNQYNTAGGRRITPEIESFINQSKK